MTECYADTLLIEPLVPSKDGYNHKHNCFKVESAMKSSDRFAVGIIDNDKKQIKYLEQFEKIDEVRNSLLLLKHETRLQFIIQICPALEKWILNICETENIDIAQQSIGLVHDLNLLKRYTKTITGINDVKLKALYKEIGLKEGNSNIKKLKGWINLLKNRNYQVDINELKNV